MSVLTLGVLARFVTTHDLPGIFAAAVQSEPWRRERNGKMELWRDGLWNEDNGGVKSIVIVMQIFVIHWQQEFCSTCLKKILVPFTKNF